jgi:Holliday junction DNA helicase RuvA
MGTFAPSPRLELPLRLRTIHAGLAAVIARLRPDVLAVEDLFHAVNARSALVLGHVRGVVLLAGADAGLPVSAFPPATVKVQVTGFGRAEKAQVAMMVSRILAIEEQAAGDARPPAHRAARLVIAHLRGRVLRKSPQEVVVDVGGVGYRVAIPVSTFYRLGDEGTEVSLRVHTQVREDALALFGFFTAHEQDLFERLIQVAGVGPKLAVNILSGIEAAELAAALRGSDIARLTRVPGVGKKTAERLVVELKDKMPPAAATEQEEETPAAATPKEDLLSALAHLGYSRAEAERGVDRALRDDGDGRFEDLLRRALQIVSGGAR